jgi:flagellar basal body-associated protein FliL
MFGKKKKKVENPDQEEQDQIQDNKQESKSDKKQDAKPDKKQDAKPDKKADKKADDKLEKDSDEDLENVEKKPLKKKFLIMVGGIILIAILLGAGGFVIVKSMTAPSEAAENTAQNDSSKAAKETSAEFTGIFYSDFDAFITVLAPSETNKFTYLKFVPKFEMSNAKSLTEIAQKLPLVEDKINSVMTDLEWDSVKSEKGRERQAEKLQKKLNEILETGEIVKVYFTTFVVQ